MGIYMLSVPTDVHSTRRLITRRRKPGESCPGLVQITARVRVRVRVSVGVRVGVGKHGYNFSQG